MAISRDNLPDHVRREVNLQIASQDRKAAPYADKGKRPTRKGGYGAVKTYSELIGRTFASKFERKVAETLWFRQKAGEISELAFQRGVTLLGCIRMRPDFRYIEDGQLIYHEAKGFADDRWRTQRRIWEIAGPTPYKITMAKGPDIIINPKPSVEMIEIVLRHLEKHPSDGQA